MDSEWHINNMKNKLNQEINAKNLENMVQMLTMDQINQYRHSRNDIQTKLLVLWLNCRRFPEPVYGSQIIFPGPLVEMVSENESTD